MRLDIQNQFQTDNDNKFPHTAPIPHQHPCVVMQEMSIIYFSKSHSFEELPLMCAIWNGCISKEHTVTAQGGRERVLWVTDTLQRVAPKVIYYSKIEAEWSGV